MDIGTEETAIIVEPIEDPFRKAPAPRKPSPKPSPEPAVPEEPAEVPT